MYYFSDTNVSSKIIKGDVNNWISNAEQKLPAGGRKVRGKKKKKSPLSSLHSHLAWSNCDNWGLRLSVLRVLWDTYRDRQLPPRLRRKCERPLTSLPSQSPCPHTPAAPDTRLPLLAHLFSLFCARPSHSVIWIAFECHPQRGLPWPPYLNNPNIFQPC